MQVKWWCRWLTRHTVSRNGKLGLIFMPLWKKFIGNIAVNTLLAPMLLSKSKLHPRHRRRAISEIAYMYFECHTCNFVLVTMFAINNVGRTLLLGLSQKQTGRSIGYSTLLSLISLLKHEVQCL